MKIEVYENRYNFGTATLAEFVEAIMEATRMNWYVIYDETNRVVINTGFRQFEYVFKEG